MDVTLAELAFESFFPADEQSGAILRQLSERATLADKGQRLAG
jgi:hypothetical protein